jgi:hypothetical protein
MNKKSGSTGILANHRRGKNSIKPFIEKNTYPLE